MRRIIGRIVRARCYRFSRNSDHDVLTCILHAAFGIDQITHIERRLCSLARHSERHRFPCALCILGFPFNIRHVHERIVIILLEEIIEFAQRESIIDRIFIGYKRQGQQFTLGIRLR